MKKGFYLFAPIEEGCVGNSSGIEKKIISQVNALNKDIKCELKILEPNKFSNSIFERIYRRLPWTAAWRKWRYYGEFNEADFLYIRMVSMDSTFIRYLKDIKKKNSNIRIIYEIPTYPLKEKICSLSNLSFNFKERNARKKLYKYVDRIVTFYGQDKIWNIPCIKLINGYDYSKVSLPKRDKSNVINIMSVALNAFWHGYDRLIEGLNIYYKNGGEENFIYHFVGPNFEEYKKKAHEYNLNDHIVFYDSLSGKELDNVYKKSLIGIDVLGGHRKNYPISSSLKSREYCAWGLPLITSSPVDFFPKDYKYQLIVPYDDSPIDMKKVALFYHNIYDNNDCNIVSKEIREFGEKYSDMSITMKPVVDYINENC